MSTEGDDDKKLKRNSTVRQSQKPKSADLAASSTSGKEGNGLLDQIKAGKQLRKTSQNPKSTETSDEENIKTPRLTGIGGALANKIAAVTDKTRPQIHPDNDEWEVDQEDINRDVEEQLLNPEARKDRGKATTPKEQTEQQEKALPSPNIKVEDSKDKRSNAIEESPEEKARREARRRAIVGDDDDKVEEKAGSAANPDAKFTDKTAKPTVTPGKLKENLAAFEHIGRKLTEGGAPNIQNEAQTTSQAAPDLAALAEPASPPPPPPPLPNVQSAPNRAIPIPPPIEGFAGFKPAAVTADKRSSVEVKQEPAQSSVSLDDAAAARQALAALHNKQKDTKTANPLHAAETSTAPAVAAPASPPPPPPPLPNVQSASNRAIPVPHPIEGFAGFKPSAVAPAAPTMATSAMEQQPAQRPVSLSDAAAVLAFGEKPVPAVATPVRKDSVSVEKPQPEQQQIFHAPPPPTQPIAPAIVAVESAATTPTNADQKPKRPWYWPILHPIEAWKEYKAKKAGHAELPNAPSSGAASGYNDSRQAAAVNPEPQVAPVKTQELKKRKFWQRKIKEEKAQSQGKASPSL